MRYSFIGNLVNNGGTLSPGYSPGDTHVVGGSAQSVAGVMSIELGGTEPGWVDVVTVELTASLAGTLDVVFWSCFSAAAGDSFDTLFAATLSGTIGQPDARNHPEPMSGGSYTTTGGFWVIPECPAIQPDHDGDCDVDQGDYTIFEACASGPGVPYDLDCDDRDFDGDDDVDQSDFAVFQRCISGEGNPADPNCAD